MKRLIMTIIGFFFLFSAISQSVLPETFSTSGDHFTGTNAGLSFTIGEPIIETISNTTNILTQGFQQTNYTITSLKEFPDFGDQILVFPNPVSNTLQVCIDGELENSNLNMELIDDTGKILITDTFSKTDLSYLLNMREYPRGNYFLRITNKKEGLVNSYKIQKY
jgi:Secretion system C-terminal sorting domain